MISIYINKQNFFKIFDATARQAFLKIFVMEWLGKDNFFVMERQVKLFLYNFHSKSISCALTRTGVGPGAEMSDMIKKSESYNIRHSKS
jgi:hypothetical protein